MPAARHHSRPDAQTRDSSPAAARPRGARRPEPLPTAVHGLPPSRVPVPATETTPSWKPTGGRRLPLSSLGQMEAAFGFNFGDTRIHADDEGAAVAAAHDAAALTAGSHIAFAPGHFTPEDGNGLRLLAHELAHIVQQGQPDSAPDAHGYPSSEAHEHEARAAASRVARGLPAGIAPAGQASTTRGRVLRQPKQEAMGREPLVAHLECYGYPPFPGIVVFNQPVTVEMARSHLWEDAPPAFESLTSDPIESPSSVPTPTEHRQRRYLLDAPDTKAMHEAASRMSHGLGAEWQRRAFLAQWRPRDDDPFAQAPWVPQSLRPTILGLERGTYTFEGYRHVKGKDYRADIVVVVKTPGREISVMQRQPSEQDLSEIFGEGREYPAHLASWAHQMQEKRVRELLEQGFSLEDAQALYRREAEKRFLWVIEQSAYGMMGAAGMRIGQRPWYGGLLPEPPASFVGGPRTMSEEPPPPSSRSEVNPIPVVNSPTRPSGTPGGQGGIRIQAQAQPTAGGGLGVRNVAVPEPGVTPAPAPRSAPAVGQDVATGPQTYASGKDVAVSRYQLPPLPQASGSTPKTAAVQGGIATGPQTYAYGTDVAASRYQLPPLPQAQQTAAGGVTPGAPPVAPRVPSPGDFASSFRPPPSRVEFPSANAPSRVESPPANAPSRVEFPSANAPSRVEFPSANPPDSIQLPSAQPTPREPIEAKGPKKATIGEGTTGPYGLIRAYGLPAHEFVPHAWLRAHGYVVGDRRHPDNPSIAISPTLHYLVGMHQLDVAIRDPALMAALSLDDMLNLSTEALAVVGVDPKTIDDLRKESRRFVMSLPTPRVQPAR